MEKKKFLDQTGISVIWSKIEENYPTNEDLTNALNSKLDNEYFTLY